jgi:tRNA(fMet)-specific endonuclease VapC
MPAKALLDTDTLSAIMRQHPAAISRARKYLGEYRRFTFSLITRYEIVRGLLAKGATRQRADFEKLCAVSEVLPVDERIISRAAEIYADLYNRGELIGDADILIAATALENGLAAATNNQRHLGRVTGLALENWL